MPVATRHLSPARLSGLMRDLSAGFRQQMFFWGRDVVHSSGNLLREQGFERRPSAGLQGTSCYRLPWEGGAVELHGACAGWFPDGAAEGGFLFIRPAGRCFLWLGASPAVPGDWPPDRLGIEPVALHAAAKPFLRWWQSSEEWVHSRLGPAYRRDCFRHFKKLPKARVWLPPVAGLAWLRALHDKPETLKRLRQVL